MKKLNLIVIIAIIISMISCQVSAASLVMTGKTDGNSFAVTVLVAKKDVELRDLKGSDIFWIDQKSINSDGSFVLTLPVFSSDEYTLYSNAASKDLSEGKTRTIYVSSTGSSTNIGETSSEPTTLAAAYKIIDAVKEIVLMDSIAYEDAPQNYAGGLTIKGYSGSEVLTLPSTVSLKGDLKLDNLVTSTAATIYANGHSLEIGNNVTSNDRLTVYGGSNGVSCASTNIKLYGGKYTYVYGGGYETGGVVTDNTNVIIGGNANLGDGIIGNQSNFSPCYVFGGGYNAPVGGKTNLTLEGNAVTKYLIGAGSGTNGTVPETNIYINGGSVMNVYAGSTNTHLVNCNTHITMTGGTAEALFGGSESQPLTGNTCIIVKGGEVTRRIYTGCYNNWELSWGSHNYVTGTTTLILYPDVTLVSPDKLSSDDRNNLGVFSGSRVDKNYSAEHNMLIFLDDCYNTKKSKIGMLDTGFASYLYPFKSYADYTVTANSGGDILPTGNSGEISIIPDEGYYGYINDQLCNTYTVPSGGSVNVTFDNTDFNINSVEATKSQTAVTGTADIIARNNSNEPEPKLYIALIDADTNMLLDCDVTSAITDKIDFNFTHPMETGKKYIIRAMIWNGELKNLTTDYTIELK